MNTLHLRRLSSTVPACVGEAPALQSLQLGGNALTGSLPALPPASRLRVLNVTDNLLDGEQAAIHVVPRCLHEGSIIML